MSSTAQHAHSSLIAALAAAQGEFETPKKGHKAKVQPKDKSKRAYEYSYATMADVLAAVQPALSRHGIAHAERIEHTDKGFSLVMSLMWGDGEGVNCIESRWPLTLMGRDEIKKVGSELTYARRYLFVTLLGIAPSDEEDDGAQADEARAARAPQHTRPRPAAQAQPNPASKAEAPKKTPTEAHASWTPEVATEWAIELDRFGTKPSIVEEAVLKKHFGQANGAPRCWSPEDRARLINAFESGNAWEWLGLPRPPQPVPVPGGAPASGAEMAGLF